MVPDYQWFTILSVHAVDPLDNTKALCGARRQGRALFDTMPPGKTCEHCVKKVARVADAPDVGSPAPGEEPGGEPVVAGAPGAITTTPLAPGETVTIEGEVETAEGSLDDSPPA